MKRLSALILSILIAAASGTAQSAHPVLVPAASKAATAVLPADTEIHLQLVEPLSSASAQEGQIVHFKTTDDTLIRGVLLVREGTPAEGVVTEAKRKGHLGRAGVLNIDIRFLRLPDGQSVALVGGQRQEGEGHGTRTAVAVTVSAVILWPAAPFFLLMHGKDVTLPYGTRATVFVDKDTVVPLADYGTSGD